LEHLDPFEDEAREVTSLLGVFGHLHDRVCVATLHWLRNLGRELARTPLGHEQHQQPVDGDGDTPDALNREHDYRALHDRVHRVPHLE
jgi:hypothetical protein